MARRKRRKAAEVVNTYETEITYECPVRGTVTQKIKVKRFKAAERSYLQEVAPVDIISESEEDLKLQDI